jgi:hypothetical protein
MVVSPLRGDVFIGGSPPPKPPLYSYVPIFKLKKFRKNRSDNY